MVGKGKKIVSSLLFLLCAVITLSAQNSEPADSLVRLVKAKSIEMYDRYGRSFRKAVDATFLHNGTYLICDTALWNVDTKIINSWGHVQLIQDETVLTSEKLDYYIDDDLAQFRGGVVQLRNKKDNILRTRHLDYNTRDSSAVFQGGASMRDQDGQVIESMEGTYNSKTKLFTFHNKVNMYTDSVFVRTTDLIYDGERNTAEFVAYVDFWKDRNMLSAGYGWYRRTEELFFFERNVHGLSQEQEVWCDSLYFHRNTQDVIMHSNVHIQDTSRHVAGMAQYVFYCDSIATITMKDEAAVAIRTEQQNNNSKIDTLYMGADSIVYHTVKNCEVDSSLRVSAKERLAGIMEDPVGAFRERMAKEAAEKAAKALEEMAKKDQNLAGKLKSEGANKSSETSPEDDEKRKAEEAAQARIKDSLDRVKYVQDSLFLATDTTKMGFLVAVGNVKIYRSDMQVRCDSLCYTDLDSIARFYIEPKVWNEGNRQYTSDSLFVLVKDGGMDRASLMSNAYIITQEDSLYFDQIKGADVMAYFDTTSALRRFDALGGATAMFFLREDEEIATVNKVECKMLSAVMKEGSLDKVYYYESPKNDAYPLAQLPQNEMKMKGFNWNPDDRPKGREDITSLTVKPSEREYYEGRPRASFIQTEIYFPGYMKSVYAGLEEARRRKRERRVEENQAQDSVLVLSSDSLSVSSADSLHLNISDSLSVSASDSVKVLKSDSLKVAVTDSLKMERPDSLMQVREDSSSMNVSDSLRLAGADSLLVSRKDTLSTERTDSISAIKPLPEKTEEQLERERDEALKKQKELEKKKRKEEAAAKRKAKAEARELRYKMRIARRDAKWARLDSLDAIKDAQKAQKELERKRKRTRVEVMEQMIQDAKDQAKLDSYVKYYEAQKARRLAREAKRAAKKLKKSNTIKNEQKQFEPSGERAPEVVAGREVRAASES